MKHLKIALVALMLTPLPVVAQNAEPEPEGFGLMEEGARLFFRGLLNEMEPALNDLEELADGLEPAMRGFVTEMGPALRDLMGEVQDWSLYHAPEILDNGDIILRRKTPQDDALDAPDPGEIDL